MAEECVDVTCPAGVGEGETIAVAFGDTTFDVTVPPGIGEGDVFSVMLPAAAPEAGGDDDVLTALNAVIDAIEDSDNIVICDLIDRHCHEFFEFEPGGEMKLEWYGLFETYIAEQEGVIDAALSRINTTPEDVFALAQACIQDGANRDNDRVNRLISRLLAIADFVCFCQMMRERCDLLCPGGMGPS